MKENLKSYHRKNLSGDRCHYDFNGQIIPFDSKFEKAFGLFLVWTGIVRKLVEGKNFKVPIKDSNRHPKRRLLADFVLRGYDVEVHPPRRRLKNSVSDNEYERDRKSELKRREAGLELIVIKGYSDFSRFLKLFRPDFPHERYYGLMKRIRKETVKVRPEKTVEEELREAGVPEWLIDA